MQTVGDRPSHDDHLHAVNKVHRQSLHLFDLARHRIRREPSTGPPASAIKITGRIEETHRIEGHQEGGVDFFVGLVGRVQEDALVCVFGGGQERVEVQAEAAVRGGLLCLVDAGVRVRGRLRGRESMRRGF
mgnify:CR=1 FL=1